jgi:hypothetical protein
MISEARLRNRHHSDQPGVQHQLQVRQHLPGTDLRSRARLMIVS